MGTNLILDPGLDPGTECYCEGDGLAPAVPGDRHPQESPERALFMAVVDKALRDAARGTGVLREEALHWLRSRSMVPLSFRWICDLLDLDAAYVWEHRANWRVSQAGQARVRGNVRVLGPMATA